MLALEGGVIGWSGLNIRIERLVLVMDVRNG
jgi:hypothetical protein